LGIIPYIALQLKAVSTSFLLIQQYPKIRMPVDLADVSIFGDTAFYIALILAVFSILFGTRHLDATERHEGLVAAIAFESIVKLVAFITVGIFITYGVYNGFGDLVNRAQAVPELKRLFTMEAHEGTFLNWSVYIFISMTAVIFLPRQFQVAVVENVNEEHLNKAIWLFPLYMLAINIFVLPVTIGGMLHFQGVGVDADTFVLDLPMAEHQEALALFVFIGGMSAATGMVIVESIALSTMICNELVMPILLRLPLARLTQHTDLTQFILAIRRGSILLVLLLGYTYYRIIGKFYALVSIGLVSFAAVAQFAPAILVGLFWKGGTRAGALCGIIAGFAVWAYTLFLPSLVPAGFLPASFVEHGPFHIALLKPFQLFGLDAFDHIAHSVFWSLLANLGAYIAVSLFSRPTAIDHTQATLFVDVFRYAGETEESFIWRGTASFFDLKSLLESFMGKRRADEALSQYAHEHDIDLDRSFTADAGLVGYAEKLLAGTIGSASARVMVASVVKEEPLGIEEVMDILDEARQVFAYSRELENTTAELKSANERLKELDRLKDQFISTITHELRTPLASIRSLTEILYDNPQIDREQRKNFLAIVVKESERLTRLINQVLDFQKIETGRTEWELTQIDFLQVINDAAVTSRQLISDKNITLTLDLPERVLPVPGDHDHIMQVMLNLISNAVKFCDSQQGRIHIALKQETDHLRVSVSDNGIGIRPEDQGIIFETFRQVKDTGKGRPAGSGLGLAITKRIIDFHKGRIWVESEPGRGATFTFTLPLQRTAPTTSRDIKV
jgi:signal transduction histidine kinase